MTLKNKIQQQRDPLTPMDLKYMKRLKFYLYLMGAWPFKELYEAYKEKPRNLPLRHFKTLFVIWTGILLGGIMYLKTYINKLSFFEIGHNYITVFLNVIAVQRVAIPFMKSYRQTMANFVLKLHLFHHKDKSDYAMKVYEQVQKISIFFSNALYMQICLAIVFFNLIPLYNNVQSGVFETNSHNRHNGSRYEHSVYYYIPFEYGNFGYSIIFIANWLISFDCSLSFYNYDLFMTLIVFNVWGHLKILKYNLEHFPKPKRNADKVSVDAIMYNKEESQEVFMLLKDNIKHHKMITQFMSLASETFGPIMCFYYLFDQVSGCIVLLELSTLNMKAIGSYGILAAILFQQLIQISIIFELIGSKNETIKHAIYALPWECMDLKNRKVVLFFLYNSQKSMKLKAMGMVSVGVQTMASILKTSFSYFIMLRAVAEN